MIRPRRLLLTMLVLGMMSGCDLPTLDRAGATFVVDVVGEAFRIRVTDPQRVEEARALLASGTGRIVMGVLARGDGGFNRGYSWHLRPETISFPDVTIELCDGKPSFVESELEYWMDKVKTYCPWSARIVREE